MTVLHSTLPVGVPAQVDYEMTSVLPRFSLPTCLLVGFQGRDGCPPAGNSTFGISLFFMLTGSYWPRQYQRAFITLLLLAEGGLVSRSQVPHFWRGSLRSE